ncbi:MAG: hypothetical protein CVU00_14140 [Bacteroidetes bacterium HGW-Bacteroidetes-17]|jgi:uncharacterized protein (DUF1697 family)|nr:MAG: hypothetical protein CVU00_14140 [Bacteroidetes bacterium HGW-Bacteroidetes-17]
MQTYISLLRGINVSGQKIIKMAALKKMYEDLKFMNVQTYIQSGNVVFQASETTKEELETLISNQIKSDFGFEVPVLVLDTKELKEIMEQNPFALDQNKNSSSIYITFLSSKPGQIDQEILRQKQVIGEEFILTEKAVYLYCPNGYGKTKLTNTFIENRLQVRATTRNLKTTNELLRIAENL